MATIDEMKTAGEELANGVPEEAVEIEIVDDAPEEDQNRVNLSPRQVAEVEHDDLTEYSEQAKNRLGQLKKVWHDERRAKEAATREREEALNYARAKDSEIRELRNKLGRGEQIFVTEISKAATGEIATAKERLTRAYEAGDADMIADAQEELTDAKIKLREYQSFKPTLQEAKDSVERVPEQVQARPQADEKAEKWRQKNTWFGADEEMTALALGLHEKLVRSGVDPRSDDYYRRVDENMKKRFPENFEEEQTQTEAVDKPRKAATVVAPATRRTAPTKVRLTPTAAALAKKMGITPEAYAKEMIKLGNYNG